VPHLTPEDILDLRAYERVRDEFRLEVRARKQLRRVALGPVVSVVFESVDTVRFQIQEMARVERIATDEGIEAELEVYNRLLPSPGELSATLFVELTNDDEMRQWLPALLGIERSLVVELPGVPSVRSVPEEEHGRSLTRADVTPAVHYLRLPFTGQQTAALSAGPAALAMDHPGYAARAELSDRTRGALVADLEGRTEPIPLG
jgi:hypothetical protein